MVWVRDLSVFLIPLCLLQLDYPLSPTPTVSNTAACTLIINHANIAHYMQTKHINGAEGERDTDGRKSGYHFDLL